jgi:hypothetical protein
LGHGDFGSLEILAQAAVLLDDRPERGGEEEGVDRSDDIEDDGWRCGTPCGVETRSIGHWRGSDTGCSGRPGLTSFLRRYSSNRRFRWRDPMADDERWQAAVGSRSEGRSPRIVSLFRREVLDTQRERALGDVLLVQPLSSRALTLVAVALAAALVTFVFWASTHARPTSRGISCRRRG